MGVGYAACTKTGRAVLDGRTIKCKTCRHHAIESALDGANCCPLCHSAYPDERRALIPCGRGPCYRD